MIITPGSLLSHFAVLPIVLPLLAGAALLLLGRRSERMAGIVGAVMIVAMLGIAATLLGVTSSGAVIAYQVGNWAAPWGITLMVDRLAALMLGITAVVALASQLAAVARNNPLTSRFPALLQFQLVGLNGAFLTGDLFNLFVFFEVLLVASYAMLLDGAWRTRLRAGLHYVTINLLGSALFLIAVSLLYGTVGTLNLADLAVRIATLPAADLPLVHTAALLLLIVFGIKAAALPLGLWLPGTYGTAAAPTAALFAIMTKVGVYAIIRVHGSLFGAEAGVLAGLMDRWLLPAGLATLALAAMGTLAARDLRVLAAWLIVGSAGTLLAALGLGSETATAAALFYLPHSTFAGAALFLIVEWIAIERAHAASASERYLINAHVRLARSTASGAAFFLAVLVAAGLPPGSGFIAKALVLDAATASPATHAPFWIVLLLASLCTLVALARAGSAVFWKPMVLPAVDDSTISRRGTSPGLISAIALLLGAGIALVLLATGVHDYTSAAAHSLGTP